MTNLELAALLLGGAMAAMGACFILAPAAARAWAASFPRSSVAAWLLTGVDLAWSSWLLFHMPMERFDQYKPLLYILTPVAFLLIVYFMDDLLAPRALGGLFLLIPAPLLAAARWQPSPWRLVVVVLAFLLAIKGTLLVLNPYLFRKAAQIALANDERGCFSGAVALILGVAVMTLGLLVFC